MELVAALQGVFRPRSLPPQAASQAGSQDPHGAKNRGIPPFFEKLKENCKKALTRLNTVHICRLTGRDDGFTASHRPVANIERTASPPVAKIGEGLLSASFCRWLFDIVDF